VDTEYVRSLVILVRSISGPENYYASLDKYNNYYEYFEENGLIESDLLTSIISSKL
jgi:hypothetical protein